MSDALRTARCKGCGRVIFFAMDETGSHQQILDVTAPVFVLTSPASDWPTRVRRIPDVYVSHFATCPEAEHFSRTRRCTCGHGKRAHADGACEFDTCLCGAFHEALRHKRQT